MSFNLYFKREHFKAKLKHFPFSANFLKKEFSPPPENTKGGRSIYLKFSVTNFLEGALDTLQHEWGLRGVFGFQFPETKKKFGCFIGYQTQ